VPETEPSRDVDAVAEDVAAVGDHVAEIDPDAKAQAGLLGEIQISVRRRVLYSPAQRTASTTPSNSANTPSAVVLTIRTRCSRIDELRLMRSCVPSSSVSIKRK
jgi:hypothetical protein